MQTVTMPMNGALRLMVVKFVVVWLDLLPIQQIYTVFFEKIAEHRNI